LLREDNLMILVVASGKDVAGVNIAEQILSHYTFEKTTKSFQENPVYTAKVNGREVKLITLTEESVYAQYLTNFFTPELIVFISRHSSKSRTPTLSVHTPGNLGEAKLGGLPRKVSFSPANAMRDALRAMMRLKKEMNLDYEVSYECTHHGPSLDVPAMFTELGSSLRQWRDSKAAEAVAHATIEAVSKFRQLHTPVVLGIGGPHYNEKFSQMALRDEIAFGHMIPKYAISGVDAAILKQCVERTFEEVELAVLDWKGIKGEHKPKLVAMLNGIGLPMKKV
jgi:D-aminoacyl-tRNA deacylase